MKDGQKTHDLKARGRGYENWNHYQRTLRTVRKQDSQFECGTVSYFKLEGIAAKGRVRSPMDYVCTLNYENAEIFYPVISRLFEEEVLDSRDMGILFCRVNGMTHKEIGKLFEIDRGRVSHIEVRLHRLIQGYLKDEKRFSSLGFVED